MSSEALMASASLAGRCSIMIGCIPCRKQASSASLRWAGESRAVLLIITSICSRMRNAPDSFKYALPFCTKSENKRTGEGHSEKSPQNSEMVRFSLFLRTKPRFHIKCELLSSRNTQHHHDHGPAKGILQHPEHSFPGYDSSGTRL